jgi:hypothetical protein
MNESYGRRGYAERGYARDRQPRDRQKSTTAGGVILAVLGVLCTFLVIWGLYYATGTGARHKVALAAAGCEPNLSPTGPNAECTTVFELNNQYKRIANPVIQQVNADVADYTANERHDLSAAEAALRAEVATESVFNQSLAKFRFPPIAAPKAAVLMRLISAQTKLTADQARSSSLAQMRSFNGRVRVASAAIRTELTLVRKALEKPVTPDMEP